MERKIFETIVVGSNTVFLDVPEESYFVSYKSIDEASATDIAKKYFISKKKSVIPHVKEIEHDPCVHTVKITVEIENDKCMGSLQG